MSSEIVPANLVPDADSTRNTFVRDVIGNKEDAAARTADVISLVAIARKALDEATETAYHFHSGQRGFGAAASPSGETHIADRVGTGAAGAEAGPLVVDAGNDDWGTWTQILGSSDTPVDSGSNVKFDFNEVVITAYEHTSQRYMIQIALQEDAPSDDPGASDTYTEWEATSGGVGVNSTPIQIPFNSVRVAVGTKVWMRTRAPNQDTSTISFYIYLHEYVYP